MATKKLQDSFEPDSFEPDNTPQSKDYFEETLTEPPMSAAKSAGYGALQGATLGFGDELSAGAGAGLQKLLTNDPQSFGELYKQYRASDRADYARAQESNPKTYLAGSVAGGVPLAVASGGSELANVGLGAAGALGTSNADLTKGEGKQALEDAASGAILGYGLGSAGKAVGQGLNYTARGVSAAKNFPKVFTEWIRGLTERGGDPTMIKGQAGQDLEAALAKVGTNTLQPSEFESLGDSLRNASNNPAMPRPSPQAEKIVSMVDELRARRGGSSLTVQETVDALKGWGQTIRGLRKAANGPNPAPGAEEELRYAVMAQKALAKDLEAAGGTDEIQSARQAYGKGARAEDLQDLVAGTRDPNSPGGRYIDPNKFVRANSGSNEGRIDELFPREGMGPTAAGPDVQKSWQDTVELGRALADSGMYPPALNIGHSFANLGAMKQMWNRIIAYKNLPKILTNPRDLNDFKQLLRPDMNPATPQILSRLVNRVIDDEAFPWLQEQQSKENF